ncbi:hypothetical protein NEIRO03_2515 [Nematocida sp. AWRm78]|nr:hypothetical protein NEIRO02_1523 [Nematocida sp. AWRm79]KAI5187341.1 hypothetical protein NEIRO03_2515 [Nematocida sp. AWRm78]
MGAVGVFNVIIDSAIEYLILLISPIPINNNAHPTTENNTIKTDFLKTFSKYTISTLPIIIPNINGIITLSVKYCINIPRIGPSTHINIQDINTNSLIKYLNNTNIIQDIINPINITVITVYILLLSNL